MTITPGQAAYEAWFEPRPPETSGWVHMPQDTQERWEAAARAAIAAHSRASDYDAYYAPTGHCDERKHHATHTWGSPARWCSGGPL